LWLATAEPEQANTVPMAASAAAFFPVNFPPKSPA
jgi:hypothetical protein